MNIHHLLRAASVILPLAVGCAGQDSVSEEITQKETHTQLLEAGLPEDDIIPGLLNIKVSSELASELEKNTDADGFVRVAKVKSMPSDGIVSLKRLFPDAGEFEPRTRAAGLHLWYVVKYDTSVSSTRAAEGLMLPDVDVIEFNPKIHITGDPVIVSYEDGSASAPVTRASSSSLPFDDPRLSSQWNYYNDGKNSYTVSGCDINVVPVWKTYTTGNPDVIVSVVDGGVDYTHEDLAANMWNNPDKTGNAKYGYNFVSDNFLVTAESHGTHVAGTIAAVNNNSVGVCGIAGGNAKEGVKGVKIMSCQIFKGNDSGSGASAIKWGADHGAVISQNSWGYESLTSTPQSLKAAVDYFIEYAGVDASGNQSGPMKGGIVIFAAGNEDTNVSGNSYDAIFNVASVGADYKRAYYSNYGSWVDIAAPGGDARKGNQILSTLPGDKYGTMQGTSMACPHVSGVAALIVSRSGGTGFTSASLEKKLLSGATDISSFNPNFKMGAGLVNAYRSIVGSGGKAPNTPTELLVSSYSNDLSFSVNVPADQDDGLPVSIFIYYDTKDFSETGQTQFAQFYIGDLQVGETLTGTIQGLDFNTKYYVAAAANDLAGNKSKLTSRVQVTSGENHPPVLTPVGSFAGTETPSVSIKPFQKASVGFEIAEPDNHYYTIDLSPGIDGLALDTLVRNEPKVVITGSKIESGSYTASLLVTDSYGLSASRNIRYTIQENHAPVIVKDFGDMIFNSKSAVTTEMDVKNYFSDEDGEDLTYKISIDNSTVVNLTQQDSKFFLTPMNYGYAKVTVIGTDVRNESVSQSFNVLVRDGDKEADIYPNPVKTNLNIRTGTQTSVEVRIVSASGRVFFEKTLDISPFSPAVVAMSDASAGEYTVILKINGKELKHYIVKL